jgi:hypothetical protein
MRTPFKIVRSTAKTGNQLVMYNTDENSAGGAQWYCYVKNDPE